MKILLLMSLLSFNLFGAEKNVAELSLNLNLQKLCDEDYRLPCLTSVTVSFGNDVVQLEPQNDDSDDLCDVMDNDECETEDPYHYRGIWSKVVERDGQRAIGIVSIDRYKNINMDGKEYFSYSLTGEIIGDKGLEGKLNISTDDLKNLNDLVLEGNIRNVGRDRYQASLRIGKPIVMCIPAPGEDGCSDNDTAPIPTPNPTPVKSNTTVDVILGTLK